MIRVVTLVAFVASASHATQIFAADSAASHAPNKRQMVGMVIDCMKRRMAIDRHISYNEAAKVCKDQVVEGDASGGALVASDTPATR